MSKHPVGWSAATIADVTEAFLSIDPTRTPERAFKYVDIGSIDNLTQTISDPKSIAGRDAPSRARRIIKEGDTLFSTVRTYLKNIALVPTELDGELTSTGIAVLRPSKAIDARYLFRWTCSGEFIEPMSKAQDGTMYPAVSDHDVAAAYIPVPPLPEQRRIVAKIDSLSTKSARARDRLDHIPRLVETYKQAVLAAAFRGELTREWRSKQAAAGCWRGVLTGDLVSWSSGKNLPTKKQSGGTIPVIGGNGIGGYHDQALITHDTVVIGRVGAQCGNVHLSTGPAWITDNAIYARAISGDLDPRYAVVVLRTKDLNRLAGGTGQPYVNQNILNAVEFELPPLSEQQEILRLINTACTWIDRLANEAISARKLVDHLDQAVLAKAFRGELVPQDRNDEPASILLERIRAERGGSRAATTRRGRRAAG